MPWEWWLGWLCEEQLATSLIDATRQPMGVALRVLELRSYARTKQQIEEAEDDAQLPSGPMAELVFRNMARKLKGGG
jgi:hypothetical protein